MNRHLYHPRSASLRARWAFMVLAAFAAATCDAAEPAAVDIGSRRKLFEDDFQDHSIRGAQLRLHHPTPLEVVITYDAPNEGNTSCYVRVFKDGEQFRMYYRGSDFDRDFVNKICAVRTCPSTDSINWTSTQLIDPGDAEPQHLYTNATLTLGGKPLIG